MCGTATSAKGTESASPAVMYLLRGDVPRPVHTVNITVPRGTGCERRHFSVAARDRRTGIFGRDRD